MKILSLFDGMACGMLAMIQAGVTIDRYVAYEIDKYAIKVAKHNFPNIEEMGDVFEADFTQYKDFDFLVGGSPCTYWSIAQNKNRETKASGLGWELFSQYVRALKEAKPKYFIYENNKSMSNAIRDSIRDTFGFTEICINSALVSAQNRQRYYWVGKLNDNGTYDKVDIEQPMDRGILLNDILDGNCISLGDTHSGKSHTLTASYYKCGINPFNNYGNEKARPRVAEKISYADRDKSHCLCSNHVGAIRDYFKKGQSQVAFEKADNDILIPGKPANSLQNTFEVKNGEIKINGKIHKIRLDDGIYKIRKLSVDECKRLQTVPEWYDFSCISNSRAYGCLGNGWTVEVIRHLILGCLGKNTDKVEFEQLRFF